MPWRIAAPAPTEDARSAAQRHQRDNHALPGERPVLRLVGTNFFLQNTYLQIASANINKKYIVSVIYHLL